MDELNDKKNENEENPIEVESEIVDSKPEATDDDYDDEELELNHSDKLVGIFSEPASTFQTMAQLPIKATD